MFRERSDLVRQAESLRQACAETLFAECCTWNIRQQAWLAGSRLSERCASALRRTDDIGVLKLRWLGGTGDSNHFL